MVKVNKTDEFYKILERLNGKENMLSLDAQSF